MNWTNDGSYYSSDISIQPKGKETANGDFASDTFVANFVKNGFYLINLYTTEGGHVQFDIETISTEELAGQTVRAVAETGYNFVKWIDSNGNTLTTDDVLKIDASDVTSDTWVTAVFEANTDAEITYRTDPLRGTVTVESEIAIVGGTAQGSKAIPKEGYRFISWVDEQGFNASYFADWTGIFAPSGSQVYNGAVYTAIFEPDSYDHYLRMGTDSAEHGYIISPDYDNTVDDQVQSMYISEALNGDLVVPATIEAVAYEEYLFDHWELNGEIITRNIDGEDVPLGSTIPSGFNVGKYLYPWPEDPEDETHFYSRDNYLIACYIDNPNITTHKIEYKIKTSDGGNGGTITNTEDTWVGSNTSTIRGSKATPNTGYKFGGWIEYIDDTQTTYRVLASSSFDSTFVPAGDRMNPLQDTTYYALFYKEGAYVGYNMNLSGVDVTWKGPATWAVASGVGAPMYYSSKNDYKFGDTIHLSADYIPEADGYYFMGWFDKDRPNKNSGYSGRNATIYKRPEVEAGKDITFPYGTYYSTGSRFTLEALWFGMNTENLMVPYDGGEKSITGSEFVNGGTIAEANAPSRYREALASLMSDLVLVETYYQIYDENGEITEDIAHENDGTTKVPKFSRTEPGTYKVRLTSVWKWGDEEISLSKDAYLIIYPATVKINKIWIDWYNETGIRPDEDEFTVKLNQGSNQNVTVAQAAGNSNASEPIWIPEAADKWSKTYENVLVRPTTTGTDQTSNYYNYTADEIVPTYYTKLSETRVVSEDKLSTEITIVNRIEKHPITFIKHNEEDDPLSGAEFVIKMIENARFDDNEATAADKQPNKQLTWTVNVGSQTVDLYEGFYQIDETVAPTNYAKIGTQYFTVKNGVVTLTDVNKNPLGNTGAITITNDTENGESSFIIRDGRGQEITLKKVGVNNTDQSGTQTNLGGAKFTIYEATGTNKDRKGAVVEVDGTELENLTSANTTGIFWSGTLPAGDYLIEEIEAPAGYNRMSALIKMSIDGNGVSLGHVGTVGTPPYNAPSESEGVWTITLINTAGVELPASGGPGTTWIYLLGTMLLLGCGITLVVRRRMTMKPKQS